MVECFDAEAAIAADLMLRMKSPAHSWPFVPLELL
jgi:hypothetical protein